MVRVARGAQVRRVASAHWLRFFPHFPPEALGEGVRSRLERLQGQCGIYYVGELNAGGVTIANNADYAARLVSTFFANARGGAAVAAVRVRGDEADEPGDEADKPGAGPACNRV